MNLFIYQFIALVILLAGACAGAWWYINDLRKSIRRLTGNEGTIEEDVLQSIMRRVARLEAKEEEIDPRLMILEEIAASSIQKIGFVRFNPFPDTGGDNSFMLVMLDRDNSGVLLSSLYMREGARIYAKAIDKGRAKHPLSADEDSFLIQTLQQN